MCYFSSDKDQKIATEVIKTLFNRFNSFPDENNLNRNAPFHEAFLKAFNNKIEGILTEKSYLISLSSWLHGLNTTLGQSFFEKVAHHLSDGEKREYTSKKLGNLELYEDDKVFINNIISNLSNSGDPENINSDYFNNKINKLNTSDIKVKAIDFSIDVFIEENDTITAIELKTVNPNSGEMKGEKNKILEGKVALKRLFPKKKIDFFIGFPFDPFVINSEPYSINKENFIKNNVNMIKYLHKDEILLGDELWNKLSKCTGSMEKIVNIIGQIATIEFLDNFKYLSNNLNRNEDEYEKLAKNWFLHSEVELIKNWKDSLSNIKNNNELNKQYNKLIFNNYGEYNYERANKLLHLINKIK